MSSNLVDYRDIFRLKFNRDSAFEMSSWHISPGDVLVKAVKVIGACHNLTRSIANEATGLAKDLNVFIDEVSNPSLHSKPRHIEKGASVASPISFATS